jgi:hypothetical protein
MSSDLSGRHRRSSASGLEESGRWNEATVAVGKMPALRPKVEDWCTAGPRWGEGKRHRHQLDLVACGSHHRPRIVDPDVVGLREIEFALMARDREIQSLHQLAVLRPTDVLLVVVAHVSECRSPRSRPEVGAASLQSERLRVAIPPRCRKIPPEVRSACGKVQLAPEFRPSDALSHAKHDSGGGA